MRPIEACQYPDQWQGCFSDELLGIKCVWGGGEKSGDGGVNEKWACIQASGRDYRAQGIELVLAK